MHSKTAKKEYSRKMKEYEMSYWKYDIESYTRTKRMRELCIKINRDTTWYDDYMKRIRDRWPNVKNWD